MAEPSELENTAQASHQNISQPGQKQQEPKKPETPLEEIVNFIGGAVKFGLAGAVPYAFSSIVPSMATETAVLTGVQIASDYTLSLQRGKKYTPGNLLESSVLGTATTPVIETMFRTANSMPTNNLSDYVMKAGVWSGLLYPAFVGSYLPIAYLVRNRTFKGLGTYIKENYWKTLKNAWTKLLPFSLMNVFFSPAWLQIPIAAALSYVFDRFAAPPKEEVPEHLKREKGSYLTAFPSVIGKLLYNSVYYTFSGLYDAGKALGYVGGSPISSAPAPSRASPSPAGAHH